MPVINIFVVKQHKQLLSKEHLQCLNILKKNKDIRITKPDKGGGIVLLNTNDYNKKMNDILEDQSKFQKVEKEKDKTRQDKALCKPLRILKQKDVIDSMTFERIRPAGSIIPRLWFFEIAQAKCAAQTHFRYV